MDECNISVSDADLRTHLSGGEAVETVSGVTAGDAFQQATAATQGGATVTYVSSGQASLAPSEGDFVTASQTDGVLVPQVVSQGTEDAEQTPQQHIGTMDAYPLGQHINTAYSFTENSSGPSGCGCGREQCTTRGVVWDLEQTWGRDHLVKRDWHRRKGWEIFKYAWYQRSEVTTA
uniref:Upstream stimulatory factor 1-like n=1 Tax=Ascaris lumbricoides TaxID=6252 RepID=A0A0M3I8B0_ASCLU